MLPYDASSLMYVWQTVTLAVASQQTLPLHANSVTVITSSPSHLVWTVYLPLESCCVWAMNQIIYSLVITEIPI